MMTPNSEWSESSALVLYRLDELDKIRAEHARMIAVGNDKIDSLKIDVFQAHEKIRAIEGVNRFRLWIAVSAATFLSVVVVNLLKLLFK